MAHDERIYRAPHDFNPDRYEPLANGGVGEPFPVGNFGFGRRYVDATLDVLVAVLDSHKTLLGGQSLRRPIPGRQQRLDHGGDHASNARIPQEDGPRRESH
ncbi:hypothetical protein NW767_000350 [Fusarium falciforme]|nr:hypothetical protein NW767_000350 [Fusarium falciforme]KAJ4256448.1 hypothetical protein NW757_004078 [Fusarium falciforme]